jgi:hypothetical protein
MASRRRVLLEPTDDWEQLQFQLDWTEQTRYELIRPVAVFGAPPVERHPGPLPGLPRISRTAAGPQGSPA